MFPFPVTLSDLNIDLKVTRLLDALDVLYVSAANARYICDTNCYTLGPSGTSLRGLQTRLGWVKTEKETYFLLSMWCEVVAWDDDEISRY